MQRVTITLDDDLMVELDRHAKKRGYQSRSEAIRDLTRAGLREASAAANENSETIAALIYVYDHNVRELSKRLADAFHHRHDLSLASLHVHLDEENCIEVSVLRGRGKEVRRFAEHVTVERGVHHGTLVTVPVPSVRKQGHAGH